MKTTKQIRLFTVIMMFMMGITIMTAQSISHTVARGETLQTIVEKYGVTENDIKKSNPNMGSMIYAGMKLLIPEKNNSKSETENAVFSENKHDETTVAIPENKITASQTNNNTIDLYGGVYSISYFYFGKELYNYGLSYGIMRANKIGYEINVRSSFETNSNYSSDICANYTYVLGQKGDWVMGGKVAIGPSFRSQSYIEPSYNMKTGQIKNTNKTKNALDLYLDAGFFINYKHFFVLIGGTGWAAEWKFGENYYQSGLHLSIGYSFF